GHQARQGGGEPDRAAGVTCLSIDREAPASVRFLFSVERTDSELLIAFLYTRSPRIAEERRNACRISRLRGYCATLGAHRGARAAASVRRRRPHRPGIQRGLQAHLGLHPRRLRRREPVVEGPRLSRPPHLEARLRIRARERV